MIKKFAFLLLAFLILSGSTFATPIVILTPDTISGTEPLAVNFSESSCSDDNEMRQIVSCTIDLGDGNIADFNSFVWPHTYHTIGDYEVELSALNNEGESSDNDTTTITVLSSSNAPTATLNVNPSTGDVPLIVTFTGSCADIDDDLATCKINFGDGNSDYDFVTNLDHNYETAGDYDAILTATDEQAAKDMASVSITVNGPNQAPVAENVEISPGSPQSNDDLDCTYDYDDNEGDDEDEEATTFLWFKDGGPTSETGSTVDSDETNEGEDWICQVTPVAATGTSPGEDENSNTVTIGSISKPNISSEHEEDTWEISDDPEFTWSSVSGATYYYLLNDSSGTTVTESNKEGTRESTSKSYLGLSNGTHYFHVMAKVGSDESATDHYKIKIDDSNPNTPTSLSGSYDSGDDKVDLDWNDNGGDSHSGIDYYKIYRGTNKDFDDASKIGKTRDSDTDYSSYSDLTDGQTYYYWVVAVDNAGNESSESSYAPVFYGNQTDRPKPTVELIDPDNDDVVEGIVEIKARATADSTTSIKRIRFHLNETYIGDGTKSGSYYVFDWNTLSVSNGDYELKATSIDEYNISSNQDSIDITVDNKTTNDTPDDDENKIAAEDAIDVAFAVKETVDSFLAEFDVLGIALNAEQAGLFEEARDLIDKAQEAFDNEDYDTAVEKADKGVAKLEELAGLVAVGTYGAKSQYVFNEEHLEIMMKGLGFSQAVCDEAKQMLEGSWVERSLSLKQIGSGNEVYYKAVITIVVRNDSGETKEVKVVEVIPKEFAETASEIAGENFTVIVDDPVLEWIVSVEAGDQATIVYALKSELTAEEADAMVDSEILNKFLIPPVLVSSETEMSKASFLGTATGLFGLGGAIEIAGIAIIIGAIIVFGALYVIEKRGKGNESPFGIEAASKRAGSGSGFFDRIGGSGKKKESSGPKWKYRS